MKIKKTVIRVKKICIWNPNKQRKKKSSSSTFRPFSQEPNATCIGSSLVILVQFLSHQTDTKHKKFSDSLTSQCLYQLQLRKQEEASLQSQRAKTLRFGDQ